MVDEVQSRKIRRVSREQLRDSLDRYSRAAFQDILADLIEAAPELGNLAEWAAKRPDKWAAVVSIMARLSGYNDETVVHNFNYDIGQMGDAQLLQQLAELRVKLDKPILTIEGSSAPTLAVQRLDKSHTRAQPNGRVQPHSNAPEYKRARSNIPLSSDDQKLLVLMQKRQEKRK